jgi:hypothetical protein
VGGVSVRVLRSGPPRELRERGDTVGYSHVTDLGTPGCRKSSRSYSQQYESCQARHRATLVRCRRNSLAGVHRARTEAAPKGKVRVDLLHGLKTVASGHRMTAVPNHGISGPTRTQRDPAAYRRNSRVLPRYRAVARSRRPHRNPCHCRVTNRPRPSPPRVCWGPASHRFRSHSKYVEPKNVRLVIQSGHSPVVFSHGVSA